MHRLGNYAMIVVLVLSLIFAPVASYADSGPQQLRCDNNGGVVPNTQLFYDNEDQDLGLCKYQGIQHVFSQIICNFGTVLDSVLDTTYCGMQYALKGMLRIVLTIYVAVFGAQLMLGTANITLKEASVRLMKIAGVWMFATQSTIGIGIVFSFFMSVMTDLSGWIVGALSAAANAAVAPLNDPNLSLGTITQGDPSNVMTLFKFFDELIYKAFSGPIGAANGKVMGFFLSMILINPIMFGIFAWWVKTTFMTLARTLLSFLVCMAAVAFLVTLSPIFLSFMLFHFTRHFFDNWIRHMISYSLQVVLVLGIIVLWVIAIIQFLSFFTQLSNDVFPFIPIEINGSIANSANSWGICPSSLTTDPDTGMPQWLCNGFTPSTNANDAKNVIPPAEIDDHVDFLYFIFFHLASLIIVSYAFNMLMESAPLVAQGITGGGRLPDILGGWGSAGNVAFFNKAADMFKSTAPPSAASVASATGGAELGTSRNVPGSGPSPFLPSDAGGAPNANALKPSEVRARLGELKSLADAKAGKLEGPLAETIAALLQKNPNLLTEKELQHMDAEIASAARKLSTRV